MISDDKAKATKTALQDHLDRTMAAVRKVTERMAPTMADAAKSFRHLGQNLSNNKEPSKHAGSKNKSKKRNKVRYLMAKRSNNINRKRIKGWKY